MAFPPTRYRDINTWLPYFSERITPVVPTRLRDAHFYTIGPHMHLHHLDYVFFNGTINWSVLSNMNNLPFGLEYIVTQKN